MKKENEHAEPIAPGGVSLAVTATTHRMLALEPTLEQTLARARTGERAARQAIAVRFANDVYQAVARIMVGRPAAWDDVAQDAMVRMLRGLGDFDPHGTATLRTWVLTIAARTAIDALRRRSRYEARLAIVATEPREGPVRPDEVAEQRELGARVAAAMEELPTDQRVALVLRAYHDQDYAEIAAATGSSVAGVKSRLNRARTALARLVGWSGRGEASDER